MANRPDTTLLKSLPQIEEVLQSPALSGAATLLPRAVLADAARASVDALRTRILAGEAPSFDTDTIAHDAAARVLGLTRPSLRRVINASGVIIHTNLGRSVLAPEAIEAVDAVIAGYSTLEYSTEKMARGSRHAHCEKLICTLTGAEAAIAVNNNAAAVMMVLTEFAAGHEAVVRAASWLKSADRSAFPTSWNFPTRAWWKWAPRTRPTCAITSARSPTTRRCC